MSRKKMEKDHPVITVSNQVYLLKMATRGFQEVIFGKGDVKGSGVESLFLALPIFHKSFLLTPGFFPWKRRNTFTAPC
jgi:hypothetical protein